ncbi:MAG: zinc ribbon domain-containing protein [Longimicrobiales bacterium]
MKCPNCGAENQTGTFCASCGAGLDVTCSECGADVPPGADYCTVCGEPVTGDGGGGGGAASLAPWLIAAASVAIVVVLVVVFLPGETRTTAGSMPAGGQPPAMGGGAPGDPSGMGGFTGDMRADADRLFNRIMMAAEQGNEGEVEQFMPMAIQAYEAVDNLDDDGLFHLGMLHLTAGSHDEAMQTAQRILDSEPDHLLGLAVAAQAAEGAGDSARAAGYWEQFLDAYETEAGRPLPAYVDHQPLLPEYRQMAREALGR